MTTSDNISAIEALRDRLKEREKLKYMAGTKAGVEQLITISDLVEAVDALSAYPAILADARKAEAMEREIAKLRGLIRDNGTPRFNAVCERAEKAEACLRDFIKAHHDGAGLLDCVDNKGERYTSHFLDEAISRARTLLNGGPDAQG